MTRAYGEIHREGDWWVSDSENYLDTLLTLATRVAPCIFLRLQIRIFPRRDPKFTPFSSVGRAMILPRAHDA